MAENSNEGTTLSNEESLSSDGEEEFKVYNKMGESMDLEPNSRKVVSKVPLIRRRGKRGIFLT